MSATNATVQLLGVSAPPSLVEAQQLLGQTAATKAEAVLLALLTDQKLGLQERKRRLEICLSGLEASSAEFGVPVRELLHPMIVSEGHAAVIN